MEIISYSILFYIKIKISFIKPNLPVGKELLKAVHKIKRPSSFQREKYLSTPAKSEEEGHTPQVTMGDKTVRVLFQEASL